MKNVYTCIELPQVIKVYLNLIVEDVVYPYLPIAVRDALEWETSDHITLNYLGDITTAQYYTAERIVNGITWPRFTVKTDGLGLFSADHKPTVLKVDVRPDGICTAYEVLDKLLSHSGCYGNAHTVYPFNPHITLACFTHGAKPVISVSQLTEVLADLPIKINFEFDTHGVKIRGKNDCA